MSTPSRQRTLEQERAARAWECIKKVRGDRGAYASLARGAPSAIQANGLGQTLAFWRGKGYQNGRPKSDDEEHAQLYHATSEWVMQQIAPAASDDLLAWIMGTASAGEYRRATVEAMAFLSWVKRFAEAELADE